MNDSFVHLHVHTEYSMLDGAAQLGDMMGEVERLGMSAIAISDHGNMLGAHDFWKAATNAGITPVIGIEAYMAPGKTPRTHKGPVLFGQGGSDDVSAKGAYTHLTMWGKNAAGVSNIFKMSSQSYLDGLYKKPRMDRELLAAHATGVIATTGCPSGEVQTYLRLGKYKEAVEAAAELRDIFEAGHFFVELMDHGLDIETRVRADILRLAKELNIPLLATNDSHYVRESDAARHEHLLCINSGSNMTIPAGDGPGERFAFTGSGYYLKSAQEMRDLFRELPEACDNTLLVAEMVDTDDIATLFKSRNLMPRFESPRGLTEAEEFEKQVWDGLAERYPDGIPDDRRQQAEYEIGVINQMGFPGYFLVVADFINWAKDNGIRVGPGRGSGAGSICAYAMKITDLDPIVHGLIFERFLNPERVSMPDFDIDFDELRRGEVIDYVTRKYGTEYVAQIVTLGRIKAKAAVKDSARILAYPYAMGDRINKAMPQPVMGKMPKLKEMFDPSHPRFSEGAEFRTMCDNEPDVRTIVDTAMGVEGLIRQTGIHAAGVIMSAEPLMDVIPIFKPKEDGGIVTQWEYPTCEDLGMVKMDFLGLSNLTTIDEALKNIKRNRGVEVDLTELDRTLDDPKTFELLARGDTLGVFQLDGGPMRALLKSMRPDNFEDISAVLALYRPGPMGVNAHNDYADRKNGRKPVKPIHPDLKEALEPILGDTYGLIVYQEQVMAIAQQLAGYTLGGADLLRRAMGKKKKAELDKQKVTFVSGMQANGFSEASIEALWDTLLPFADYAFNKAHSAAYGVISYYTAYLKANYPAEYMAALLTTNQDDKTKTAIYLNECRRMGVKVLSPDVNESVGPYAAVGDDIRVGLGAIRNVGGGVVAGIVDARTADGKFTSFTDFLNKIGIGALNKRAIESLVKAGAFDSLGHKRRALDLIHQQAVDSVASLKKQEAQGQDSLFAGLDDAADAGSATIDVPDDVAEWDKKTLLGFEKDMLGLYVSDHPLNGVGDVLRAKTDHSVGSLIEAGARMAGQMITVGGLITGFQRKVTKKGDLYGVFTLEDLDGEIEVMAFPRAYSTSSDLLVDDAFVLVKAKVEKNDDDSLKLFADTIRALDVTQAALPDPVVVTTSEARLSNDLVTELMEALGRHKGKKPVHLRVVGARSTKVWALDERYLVDMTPQFIADMKVLFGANCFQTVHEHQPAA